MIIRIVDITVLKTTNPNNFEHEIKSKWEFFWCFIKNQRENKKEICKEQKKLKAKTNSKR
jgi:hypothetical protein